jgi:cytochrome c biogenesis protein CcmG/thiol:disulfide interchange protein DsbE
MRRFAVPGVITAVVVALLAVLAFGVSHEGTSQVLVSQVQAGHRPVAPDSRMPLQVLGSSERRETLASLRGKVVMINFYAGWCVSCQEEAPLIRQAEKTLRAHGGTVLGITYQDSSPDALSYLSHYHLSFPALRDPTGSFAQAYGITGVPETFIVNRQGRVEAENTYELTKGWLDKTLDRALGINT